MNKLITLEHITYSYNNKNNVLDDINISIYKGDDVAIVGHNGSGKSTLGKLMIALLKPKKGKVFFNGLAINNKTIPLIREKSAMVFQNPDNQFIGATVADDIAFGLENIKVPHDKMKEVVDEYASLLGIADLLNREPQTLSGGQKQRVAIAGILAMRPEIIIFDEALSMLDPKGKQDISNLINEIKANNPSLTIVRITHDLDEAFNSKRVIVLEKGKILMDDVPDKVFKDVKKMEKIGLDIPFIVKFNQKLIEAGLIDKEEYSLDKLTDILCK